MSMKHSSTITVIVCHDGSKHEIKNISTSDTTLNDLKQKIACKTSITKSRGAPVKPKYQRLFYFGRELKSGSRSLDALLGDYKRLSTIMHLHSSQPKIPLDNSVNGIFMDVDEEEEEEVIDVTQAADKPIRPRPNNPRTVQEVISLDDSDDDSDDDIEILEGPSTKRTRTF